MKNILGSYAVAFAIVLSLAAVSVNAQTATAEFGNIKVKNFGCIGIINHLFRHSDQYRGFVSDRSCGSGVPCTTGIVTGKALHAVPTTLDDSIPA
jgi:hypothetical protein